MTLTLCSAGAGSGKTYRVCEEIAGRVLAGLDPARILATTFTRKAAAELRNRIEARLLAAEALPADKRAELVERLDLAAIGTVHSVAQQMVARHALALGLSPDMKVVDEKAQGRHLNQMLMEEHDATSTELDALAATFSITELDKTLLQLLELKRSNRIGDDGFRDGLLADLEPWLDKLCGGSPIVQADALDHLVAVASEALATLEACAQQGQQKGTIAAARKLATLVRSSRPAWQDFAIGEIYKGGARDGGNAATVPLADALAESLRWTGLHDDMRRLVLLVAERVVRLGAGWEAYKRARGLFDYADLELWFLRLLQSPELAAHVAARFDLAVVDEFQDTNPIQLDIFSRLQTLVADSFWVGDDKQAIYGFRGADAALVRATWDRSPDAIHDNLPKSYRSQAGLVQLVNRSFADALPNAALEPTRAAAARGVERWSLDGANIEKANASLAAGVLELLAEGQVRPGQIAVLTRTNPGALAVAAALRGAGVPRKLALPGLLDAREVAVTIAGVRVLADQSDTLAAASVIHMLGEDGGATPTWLADRLNQIGTDAKAAWSHPLLERLRAWPGARLSPTAAIDAVIAALDLPRRIATWDEPVVRIARLDALLDLARDYEDQAQEQGSGATLAGLAAWLEQLHASDDDKEPVSADDDAVLVSTMHGAKGLEWPVVILTELNNVHGPSIASRVVYGGDIAGGRPLDGRRLRWWPDPFGGRVGTQDLFADTDAGRAAIAAGEGEQLRLIYVCMTRARDKLVLALRPQAKGGFQSLALDCLPVLRTLLLQDLAPGEHPLADLGTSLVIRNLLPAPAVARTVAATTPWLLPLASDQEPAPLRVASPSGAKSVPDERVSIQIDRLPGDPAFGPTAATADKRADYGDAVHTYLATLPATRGLDAVVRTAIAADCIDAHDMRAHLQPAELVAAGECFTRWCAERFPGATLHTEFVVTGPRGDGGLWHGIVDAMLELPDGSLVVVDHKSTDVGAVGGQVAVARRYAGQLTAYRQALTGLGRTVASTWIHFPVGGVCAQVGGDGRVANS